MIKTRFFYFKGHLLRGLNKRTGRIDVCVREGIDTMARGPAAVWPCYVDCCPIHLYYTTVWRLPVWLTLNILKPKPLFSFVKLCYVTNLQDLLNLDLSKTSFYPFKINSFIYQFLGFFSQQILIRFKTK